MRFFYKLHSIFHTCGVIQWFLEQFCNSMEVLFDDDDHHNLINSFNTNEIDVLKTKESHFCILNVNIAPLKRVSAIS